MSLASRGTRAAARSLRQTQPAKQIRRQASGGHDHAHAQGHGHGQGESALHLKHANPAGNEGMGTGAYIALATIPLFYFGYSLSYGSSDNFLNRLYQQYKEGKQATADTDKLHQAVLERAISERANLSSYPRETSGPSLHNPEMFNTGSPWNQAVGESSANLKKLEEYYHKLQAEAEEERLARMKDGKVQSLYD